MNAIRKFVEKPSVETGWEAICVTAESCERFPRLVQWGAWALACMHPKGMRCPLLWQSRLTTGRVFHALHHFREAAHVWVGINDCIEVFAGIRFCYQNHDDQWEKVRSTCEDCCAFGSGFFRVIWISGWVNGSANRFLGWLVIWGEVGEPFCELMGHCRRWKQCQQQGSEDHRPMCAALGCETAFRMLEEIAGAESMMPALAFCSVAGFVYKESKPEDDD